MSQDSEQTHQRKKRGSHMKLALVLFLILSGAAIAFWYFFLADRKPMSEHEVWSRVGLFQQDNQLDSLDMALTEYIDQFPEGAHIVAAHSMLQCLQNERAEWERIVRKGCTLEAVDNFLYAHPDGFCRTFAVRVMDSLAFNHAEQEGTAEAMQAYIDRYPQGRFVQIAQRILTEADHAKLDPEEETMVANCLWQHFDFMSHDSIEIITTVAPHLSSYIGKKNSTKEDVIAYMHHVNAGSAKKQFSTEDVEVRKLVQAGVPVYNVRFKLVETINPDDSLSKKVKTFQATASLDRSTRITSLVLQ